MSVRLSIYLTSDVADILRKLASENRISATETIRRAIAVLNFVTDEIRAGNRIVIVEALPEGGSRLRDLIMVGPDVQDSSVAHR